MLRKVEQIDGRKLFIRRNDLKLRAQARAEYLCDRDNEAAMLWCDIWSQATREEQTELAVLVETYLKSKRAN